jgi:hypothetical protein
MKEKHSFSVQLNSRDHVKNMSLGDDSEVLFEGYLGELESLGLIEEAVIEIKGCNGILRTDLSRDQLIRLLYPRGEQIE